MLTRLMLRACFALGLLILATTSMGCTGGTETGNPNPTKFSAALSYTGISSNPQAIGIGAGGEIATIRSAWLDLGDVSFLPTGSCAVAEAAALDVPGLGIGDHAAGRHNFTSFEARSEKFCVVELPFVRSTELPKGAPPELRGQSVLLAGTLASGTPFVVSSDAELVIEMTAASGGFELTPAAADTLVTLDFASWFEGMDLSTGTLEGEALLITKSSNPELLQRFEANLARGAALYRDLDGDGALDDEPELLAEPR